MFALVYHTTEHLSEYSAKLKNRPKSFTSNVLRLRWGGDYVVLVFEHEKLKKTSNEKLESHEQH